jgi:hypothetical protein
VPNEDRALAEALGARELHERTMHDVEHRGAREPAERGGPARRERERRQRQVQRFSSGASANGTKPLDGRTPAASDSRRISMIPSQKSGSEMPEEPERQDARSATPPRRRAGHSPSGTPISAAASAASTVSSIVTGNRSRIIRPIGSFCRKSIPKSPRSTPPSHRAYCVGTASSR